MNKSQAVYFISAHKCGKISARAALGTLFALLLGLSAPKVRADTVTLINFDLPNVVPGTTSPQAGAVLGNQYEAQGIVFNEYPSGNSSIPNICPGGANGGILAPVFYRDIANARSQPQVAYSYCNNNEGLSSYAEIEGRLITLTDKVSVYAGTGGSAGQLTTLQGYDVNGQPVAGATASATVGANANTLLSISTPSAEIAYFTVMPGANSQGNSAPLEIDDLSFNVPSAAPPPQLRLDPLLSASGYQTQTISVPVTVQRFDGANNAIDLSVSGLPSGVTLTGGSVIPAGSETTNLMFAIAANAPAASAQYTLTAASPGVSAPPPDQGEFTVNSAFTLGLTQQPGSNAPIPSQLTVAATPCSSTIVYIVGSEGIPGTLTIASQGDTVGLNTSLNASSIGFGVLDVLTLTSNTAGSGTATYTITLSGGTAPPATATLIVNRAAPQVTSVTTRNGSTPLTPQGLQPGTLVTIGGSGFCPDSQVTFGNPEPGATATPSNIATDGTYMTVSTPVLATDGPVTVLSAGVSASSPESLHVNSYRNVNGYQFHNYDPIITFDQMTEAFGAGQTYTTIVIPVCVILGVFIDCNITETFEDPFALLLLSIANDTIDAGACFGFSLSTQRFLEGAESLDGFPNDGNNTIFGLDTPSDPSALRDFINAMHVSQLSDPFLSHYLSEAFSHLAEGGAAAAQDVYNEIRGVFSQGRFPLISMRDATTVTKGHEVVAYNIEGAPPNWYIDVYDSNEPFSGSENSTTDGGAFHKTQFEASRIQIGSTGDWSLPSSGISGDMTGLVVTDPASLPEDPTMVTDPAGLIGVLASSAAPAGIGGTGSVGLSSRITQVSDEAGHTLFDAHGNLNTNPATKLRGMPFAPLIADTAPSTAAAGALTPQIILLDSGASRLHATIADTNSGNDTHTFLGQGFAAQFVTAAAGRGVMDRLTLDPANGAGFATTAPSKPLTLKLVGATGTDRRTVEITTTSFSGAGDLLSFTNSRSGLSFIHNGPATTFTISLRTQGPTSAPTLFQSDPLPIGAGETARLDSIQWDSLTNTTLKVAAGGQTLTVPNRISPPQLATIDALQVTKVGGRTAKLTIRAGLQKLPAGAKLAFGWVVQHEGRVVASHGQLLQTGTGTASFEFTATDPGRYDLTATVTVISGSVISKGATSTSRTTSFIL